MTLQPITSEFPYIRGNFVFFFISVTGGGGGVGGYNLVARLLSNPDIHQKLKIGDISKGVANLL
jgi:hypothetical protein